MGTSYAMEKSRPGIDTALGATHPNAALMGQFAHDVAQHFGGRVSKYSIWNEPQLHTFLMRDAPQDAAKVYRDLYRAGYAGVKSANPNAKVGLGELTSGDPKAGGAFSTIGFLKQVLAGKPLRADYLAIHPYQWTNPGRAPKGMDAGFGGISNLQAVQDVLRHAASTGRLLTSSGKRTPLSLSEFGYKHDAQANAHTRAQWMARALQLAQAAHVQDVNLYQFVPSRSGDYWDSSIASAQGVLDPRMAHVLQAFRRGRLRRV
jgi:hypothetical protein